MTAPMTEQIDIDALSALESKATPGEWCSQRADFPVDGEYDYAIHTIVNGDPNVIAEAFGRSGVNTRPNAKANAAFIAALRNAAPALLAAYKAHDAAVRERDEAKRELRKCTINKDELWKVVRADADKLRQAKEDGEDVTQMLVQRDKEADEQIAALTAERDALKVERDNKPEPNPEWEASYDAFHAQNRAECGVNPGATLRMLETWKSHAEPVNNLGQATFSRAMLESATDALRFTIAALASRDATIATLRKALEPFNRDVRNGYPHNFSITVHGRNGEHVFGLLASDFDAVSAALNSARSA